MATATSTLLKSLPEKAIAKPPGDGGNSQALKWCHTLFSSFAVIHVWIQKLRPGHLWGNDCFWNVIMLLSFMSKMIGTVENPFLSIRLNLIWFSLQIPLNEKRASLFCTVSLTGFVHKTFFHGYKERNEVWKKKKKNHPKMTVISDKFFPDSIHSREWTVISYSPTRDWISFFVCIEGT